MTRSCRGVSVATLALCCGVTLAARGAEDVPLDKLSPNTWVLIHDEDGSGGKAFAKAVYAPPVGRVMLWGIGGERPARNVYKHYELEAFDVVTRRWAPAFPESRRDRWTAEDYPPFRIYGQSGPDGLKHDEGPRFKVVGGYHATNRIWWWDFDGVSRPSPVHTFNMAAWDTKRSRAIYYSDAQTFALDPATNTWTDLKPANHPTTCRTVAWGHMAYDAGRDRVMLFGGGLATNPLGGAPTWWYDCADNRWTRPSLDTQPPLRCNGAMVYDPTTESVVLFGGYDQASALNDTWVYDCKADAWAKREPKLAPPPMEQPAAALLPGGGRVLVIGNDARDVRMHHKAATSARKQTWVYDIAADTWSPLHDGLELRDATWLTATTATDTEPPVVLLVAIGSQHRRTYALRYDADAPPAAKLDTPGAPPGTVAWKYPEQKASLEDAPPPDRAAIAQRLASLPVNTFVNAEPPGMLISKTWSTAVFDTDRGCVIYHGGGHSGYSGNDFARYSVADNRWSLDTPPRFPPYLESTNAGLYGWSYGMIPFSQHTYLWYTWDPVSKTVVYLARPSLMDGVLVQVSDDPDSAFVYDEKEHGYMSWVYDPVTKTMRRPSFGRPFDNTWHLCVLGTSKGVYATTRGRTYRAQVNGKTGEVKWTLIDDTFPEPRQAIKYHYEYQPLVHDTKRDRLIMLKGDKRRVDVYARPMTDDGAWTQLDVTGDAAIGREAVYIAKHDTVLWLGEKLHALDLATNTMREVDVELPKGVYGHECAMVYDPRRDLCVALIPERFTGPMQVFLLRYAPHGR